MAGGWFGQGNRLTVGEAPFPASDDAYRPATGA